MNTVTTSFWLEMKRFWNIKSTLINMIIFPVIITSINLLVYKGTDPHVFTAYAFLGSILTGVWIGILRSTAHAIHMEKRGQTADYNVVSGSSLWRILVGKMFFSTFIVGSCTVIIVGIAVNMGKIEIAVSDYWGFLLGVCMTYAAFIAVGLILSGLSVFVRSPAEYADVLIFSVMVLSAVSYPLESQPVVLRMFSSLFPTTNGLYLTRMSILGTPPPGSWWLLGLLHTALFFGLGLLLMKYAEKRAAVNDLWRLG